MEDRNDEITDNDKLDNFNKMAHNQKRLIDLYKVFKVRDKKFTLLLNLINHLISTLVPSNSQNSKSLDMMQSLIDELNGTFSSDSINFESEVYTRKERSVSALDVVSTNLENFERLLQTQSRQLNSLQNNDSFLLDSLNIKDKEIQLLRASIENLKSENLSNYQPSTKPERTPHYSSGSSQKDIEDENYKLLNQNRLQQKEVNSLLDEVNQLKKEISILQSKGSSIHTSNEGVENIQKELRLKEAEVLRILTQLETREVENRNLHSQLDKIQSEIASGNKSSTTDSEKYIKEISELQNQVLNLESELTLEKEASANLHKNESDKLSSLNGQNQQFYSEIANLKLTLSESQKNFFELESSLKLEVERNRQLLEENEQLKKVVQTTSNHPIEDFKIRYEKIKKELESKGLIDIEKGIFI